MTTEFPVSGQPQKGADKGGAGEPKFNMRTKTEIQQEIKALRALKPVGVWRSKTQRTIEVMIEELDQGWDITSEEWEELEFELKSAVTDARRWKERESEESPSLGFGDLVVEHQLES